MVHISLKPCQYDKSDVDHNKTYESDEGQESGLSVLPVCRRGDPGYRRGIVCTSAGDIAIPVRIASGET